MAAKLKLIVVTPERQVVEAQADAALEDPEALNEEALGHALGRLEAALRARTAAGLI